MEKWDRENIKRLRQSLRLTQVEFARRLGCRQQTVSEWEQGVYAPANAYGKLLDFFKDSTEGQVRDKALDDSQTVAKRVSSFSLPRVTVPEVFREEMGLRSDEVGESERPFDPAVD